MAEGGGAPRRIEYTRARQLILSAGIVVLAVVAVVAYVRGVEPVEVAATILFIPVFLAFLFFQIPGGVVAGILAAGAYLLLRWPAIEIVGFDLFARSFVARAVAYPVFGLIGGWASKALEASLTKLELYDQIDDATGLYNARFFLQDTELEASRSKRYQTIFSVAVVDVPGDVLGGLRRRQQASLLRELGALLRQSVRSVDRVVHADDGRHHRIAVVLPETGAAGAEVFTQRLVERLGDHLGKKGVSVRDRLGASWLTFPGDEGRLEQLRSEFAAIDRTEHPAESAAAGRAAGG